MSVYASCVRACVRVCVHACLLLCMRTYMRAYVCGCVHLIVRHLPPLKRLRSPNTLAFPLAAVNFSFFCEFGCCLLRGFNKRAVLWVSYVSSRATLQLLFLHSPAFWHGCLTAQPFHLDLHLKRLSQGQLLPNPLVSYLSFLVTERHRR